MERGELRSEVEEVNESISLVTDIDECGIQPGHNFPNLAQVDVAHRKTAFATLLVQLHELFVFDKGDGYFGGGYVDY